MQSMNNSPFSSTPPPWEGFRGTSAAGTASAVSFRDDEGATQMTGSTSTARGRNGRTSTSEVGKGKTTTRGRGQGRGTSTLKQTTLDASLGFRHSQRFASVAATAAVQSIADDGDDVDSPSEELGKLGIDEVDNSSENDEILPPSRGRKRAAPRGRGRGSTQPSKRGKKSDSSAVNRMFMNKDDDDDDDDDVTKRLNKPLPRVTRKYGSLRR